MALSGKLFVAGPYSDDMVQHIGARFESLLGQPVALEVAFDERLIGGFRALIDGRLYDASLSAQTEQLRYQLKGDAAPEQPHE